MRQFNVLDRCLHEVDKAMRTMVIPERRHSKRPTPGENPAQKSIDKHLTATEKKHIAGLMRINHAGEVGAQGLYQGQALTAKLDRIRAKLEQAANEENEHLAWCEQRLKELKSQPSVLNPLWYLGSLLIGVVAGAAGDQWSLGFVAETERQVTQHLQSHLQKLPPKDQRTKHILEQMKEDEAEHAQMAEQAGAAQLPTIIKKIMGLTAQLMTKTSYYI